MSEKEYLKTYNLIATKLYAKEDVQEIILTQEQALDLLSALSELQSEVRSNKSSIKHLKQYVESMQ